MDQLAREDITAAVAAHQELGRDYDGAVAEGLVERIGEEIDKRVDARLEQRGSRSGELSHGTRPSRDVIVLGVGSITVGGITTIALLSPGPFPANGAGITVIVLMWIVIAVINIAYARRR